MDFFNRIQNKPINRTDPNQTDLFGLVSFLKNRKTEPNWTDEDFIGSNIFLIKNQSKPNRYTPTNKSWKLSFLSRFLNRC